MLTQSTGQFQSINYDNNFECSWLIAVKENHNIWLTFTEFQLGWYYQLQVLICIFLFFALCYNLYHNLQIYDGPYSTSRLISSSSQAAPSFRSSTNKLFLKFYSPYGYRENHGKQFIAHYAAVSKNITYLNWHA